MSSTERISFLQEKLQEIRKYYMSLKSEVATIDRRRKRLKKKDREGNFQICSMFPMRSSFSWKYITQINLIDSIFEKKKVLSVYPVHMCTYVELDPNKTLTVLKTEY